MVRRFGYGKRILGVFFILLLVSVWIGSSPYTSAGRIYGFLEQNFNSCFSKVSLNTDPISMDGIETEFADSFWQKKSLVNLNGAMAKRLHMQGYYSGMGLYITDSGYIVSASPWTSTDYEYGEIMSLKEYLDQKGIHLIYVNEPTKYIDDNLFCDAFGVESYSNRNADLFLRRISESGIHTLDLRDSLVRDGLDIYDMFYRTDHHWTTRSGLWATGKIAEALNAYCGYDIDLAVYDESNYTFKEWENCWLGEQGRKVAASYTGLDDYTEIKPVFATDLAFKQEGGLVQGTFADFINEAVYDLGVDVYSSPSWHYSYSKPDVINNDVDYGKVLVLGDSYEHVVVPFLSLGVSEVDSLILRGYTGSLREYIEAGDYDTVLICYAQFMIGAHDNPQSANYAMFAFD